MAVGQHQWYHFGLGAPPILEPVLVVGLGCSLGVRYVTQGQTAFFQRLFFLLGFSVGSPGAACAAACAGVPAKLRRVASALPAAQAAGAELGGGGERRAAGGTGRRGR